MPKICIKRLDELSDNPTYQVELNWVTKFKNFLSEVNARDLWPVTDLECWKNEKPEIFKRLIKSLKEDDVKRYCNSNSCLFKLYKPLTTVFDGPTYLNENHSMLIKRTTAQIRLANKYQAYLSINKARKLNPMNACMICNLNEPENIEHILFVCPAYENIINNLYGDTYTPEQTSLNFYLANLSHYDTRKLFKLTTQILEQRDSLL